MILARGVPQYPFGPATDTVVRGRTRASTRAQTYLWAAIRAGTAQAGENPKWLNRTT
jgi:hypothetical protein